MVDPPIWGHMLPRIHHDIVLGIDIDDGRIVRVAVRDPDYYWELVERATERHRQDAAQIEEKFRTAILEDCPLCERGLPSLGWPVRSSWQHTVFPGALERNARVFLQRRDEVGVGPVGFSIWLRGGVSMGRRPTWRSSRT